MCYIEIGDHTYTLLTLDSEGSYIGPESLLLFAIKMATRPFLAEIKNLRTRYCAPYKFVSFGPTNTIVSDLERYDIGLPEYVKM